MFAVGNGGLIVHYDGSNWSTMVSGTSNILNGVWARSASDVYAVGQNGTVLYYDGTSWSSIESNTSEWLFNVEGTATEAYAVGANGVILHLLSRTTPLALPSLNWRGTIVLGVLLALVALRSGNGSASMVRRSS